MKKIKKIGVLTSGGDAPGMNAAIRAVVRSAIANGVEVVGIMRGYSGLIDKEVKPLAIRDVSNIINKGGTFLYTDRCPEMLTEEGKQKAIATCRELGIDGLVVIGGDGTFRGATELTLRGVPCVGIPGTIDNDVSSTDNTIGYYTAMNTVIELVDKLRDTCESHARCNVVEVMGRDAGDIALNTAIASGATAVAIPEFEFDEERLFEKIATSRKLGKRNFIVIISEGLGADYAPTLATKIESKTGVETKFARFAHIVRGGTPTLKDRLLATQMGSYAVDMLLAGKSNIVICERNGEIVEGDITYALKLDRMYKGKLLEGELDEYSPEVIEGMRRECAERRVAMQKLYDIQMKINL
ncbi:MAG: 6-phosphofructokinase [Clostridia bacterium]|nr:6-phosphofructokinase [Clostridia bacterium]